MQRKEYCAAQNDCGVKLQIFLQRRLGSPYSVRQVKRLIDRNCCRVNGRIERFGATLVAPGDRVSLVIEQRSETAKTLFENDDFLAVDKPAGLLTESFDRPCHRLDRDTSGVLLLAKHDEAKETMRHLFATRQVIKTYIALVDGIPKPQGAIENYLGPRRRFAGQTIFGSVPPSQGKRAKTVWEVLETGSDWARIRLTPETGRTHQLRAHMAQLGHPILGDGQYGRTFRCQRPTARHLLHAESLSFEGMTILSPCAF